MLCLVVLGILEDYGKNPDIIETDSFPTTKVIGGYDFAGTNYDASSDDIQYLHQYLILIHWMKMDTAPMLLPR